MNSKAILYLSSFLVLLVFPSQVLAQSVGIYAFIQQRQVFSNPQEGIWKEGSQENSILTRSLHKPYIRGVTYWATWEVLEPIEGNLKLQSLEHVLQTAQQAGKQVNLGIMPMYHPQWLNDYPVETFSFHETQQGHSEPITRTKPFPLDPIYLRKYYSFIRRVGQQFNAHPGLGQVVVAGPSNGTGFETFIKTDQKDLDYVQEKAMALTGADDYHQALAEAWREAIVRFSQSFPDHQKSLALTVNLASLDPVPRSEETARLILDHLDQNEWDKVNPMMFNLTGKDWWQPNESYAVGRLLSLFHQAPQRGLKTGVQFIGISWANDFQEQRARPFIPAIFKAVNDAQVSWIEVWVEDLTADRSGWKTRTWVADTHPCIDGCLEGDFQHIISSLKSAYEYPEPTITPPISLSTIPTPASNSNFSPTKIPMIPISITPISQPPTNLSITSPYPTALTTPPPSLTLQKSKPYADSFQPESNQFSLFNLGWYIWDLLAKRPSLIFLILMMLL